MKTVKIIAFILCFCLLFVSCATAQTGVNKKPTVSIEQMSEVEASETVSIQGEVGTQQSSQTSQISKISEISSVVSKPSVNQSSSNTNSFVSSKDEVSSVLSDTYSEEDSSVVVSRDLPVASQPSSVNTDYRYEMQHEITLEQANAVPDYLKDHPVMEGTRDKFYWPFSKDSIWNMPIGSDAELEPAGLKAEKTLGIDPEYFVQTTYNDPIIDVYTPSSFVTRLPGKHFTGKLRVPNTFVIPDNTRQNDCATFVMPDGHSFFQMEPTCRPIPYSKRIYGYLYDVQPMSLYEKGIGGTHYGSGLSAIGGSIRKGELTSDGEINHAIKFNVWAHKYLYFSSQIQGYTWPADRCDGYANKEGNKNKYEGTNPNLLQGSLLTLPRDLTSDQLGIRTEVAKKLFNALQNYGAYIVDDTTWSAYAFAVETGVDEEVQAKYGYSLRCNEGQFFNEMMRIISKLCVVTNNSPTSIGGGGTPCKPLAPDFAD